MQWIRNSRTVKMVETRVIRPLAIVILLVGVVLGQNDSTALDDDLKDERKKYYRDGLKGGPVLLSNSQAGPGINFTQPRAHFFVKLCRAY